MNSKYLLPLCFIVLTVPMVLAQNSDSYQVPRTSYDQPDFQGSWHTEFATMLERPDGVELVVPEEQAVAIGESIFAFLPDNHDPDFDWSGVKNLALVDGEYRSSILVDPADGKLPYLESTMAAVEFNATRYEKEFDHPEQRPPSERCLGGVFYGPPIHSIPLMFPYQIVQTEEHLVFSAGGPDYRLIHLDNASHSENVTLEHKGYSTGYWDGEVLVVETTNFREDHPARSGFGRPLLISNSTVVTERFTRLSEGELHYRFTVVDDGLYSQPFSGEMSLYTHHGPVYEYGCHEGNYSLPGILRGGQMQQESTD